MNNITIRKATPEDMPQVWQLIYELALYEKAPEQVITTPAQMVRDGFGEKPLFECLVAEDEAKNVLGITLYYFAYSTWKGKMLYLDDFIVTENARGTGIGKLLFDALTQIAKEQNAKQMRWHVLDWNTPAIRFYEKINASLDEEWIQCKISLES
ncbi:MAG: N-acetyltransferase family protein [Bacteroidia bacterium]